MGLFDYFRRFRSAPPEQTRSQRRGSIAVGTSALAGATSPPPGTYDTYRAVAKHPTFVMAWLALTGPILANKWLSRADGKSGDIEEARKFVEKHLGDLRPMLVRDMLRSGVFGWSPFEKVFDVAMVNDSTRIVYRKLKWLLPDRSRVLIERESGSFAGVRNFTWGKPVDLDPDYAFVYTWDLQGQDYYGGTHPAERARPYVHAWEGEQTRSVKYSAKVSGIIPVLLFPPGTSTDEHNVERDNSEIAERILSNLGAGRGVAIPNLGAVTEDPRLQAELSGKSQWVLTFLNAGPDASEGFNERLVREEKNICRAVGIPERAVTEASTAGSRADSVSAADIGLLASSLIDSDIAAAVTKYLVNPLLRFNFGEDMVGRVRIEPAPLLDENKAAFRSLAQLVLQNPTIVPEAPTWVDWGQVFEGAGIPRSQVSMVGADELMRANALVNIPSLSPLTIAA